MAEPPRVEHVGRARFGRRVMTGCVWGNAFSAVGLFAAHRFALVTLPVAVGAAAVARLNYYLRKECE